MKVIIKGHQRSGNNYLIHLVGTNFFQRLYDKNSFSDGNDHCLLNELQPNTQYLYIFRNKEDVMKSMFAERKLYGIIENDYETFLHKPYYLMYDPNISADTIHRNLIRTTAHKIHNIFFCATEKTPNQWYDYHIERYNELVKNNPSLLIVSYNELLSNFKAGMDRISIHLTGATKDVYENIQIKVGWYNLYTK